MSIGIARSTPPNIQMKASNAQRLGTAETFEQEIIRLCNEEGSSLDVMKRLLELIRLVGGCDNLGQEAKAVWLNHLETHYPSKHRPPVPRPPEPRLTIFRPKNGLLIRPLEPSRVPKSKLPEILKRLRVQIQLLTNLEKLNEEKN
ncbi:MAG: hypothetical protein ACK551_06760 [Vampirovibrionales bacterium]